MNRLSLREIILPTRGQALSCFLLAAVLYLFTYREILLSRWFFGRGLQIAPLLPREQLVQLSGIAAVSLLVKVVFWAGVGLVAYVVYLAITNALIEARNEVVIEAEYVNKGGFVSRLHRPAIKIVLALAFVGWLLVSVQYILPIWLGAFEVFLVSIPELTSWLYLAIALLGLAITIYVCRLLGQIVFAYA